MRESNVKSNFPSLQKSTMFFQLHELDICGGGESSLPAVNVENNQSHLLQFTWMHHLSLKDASYAAEYLYKLLPLPFHAAPSLIWFSLKTCPLNQRPENVCNVAEQLKDFEDAY